MIKSRHMFHDTTSAKTKYRNYHTHNKKCLLVININFFLSPLSLPFFSSSNQIRRRSTRRALVSLRSFSANQIRRRSSTRRAPVHAKPTSRGVGGRTGHAEGGQHARRACRWWVHASADHVGRRRRRARESLGASAQHGMGERRRRAGAAAPMGERVRKMAWASGASERAQTSTRDRGSTSGRARRQCANVALSGRAGAQDSRRGWTSTEKDPTSTSGSISARNHWFLSNGEIFVFSWLGSRLDVVSPTRNGFYYFSSLSLLIRLSSQLFCLCDKSLNEDRNHHQYPLGLS